MCACACRCVCVCVWRERERHRLSREHGACLCVRQPANMSHPALHGRTSSSSSPTHTHTHTHSHTLTHTQQTAARGPALTATAPGKRTAVFLLLSLLQLSVPVRSIATVQEHPWRSRQATLWSSALESQTCNRR